MRDATPPNTRDPHPSDDDLALAAKGGDREARNTLYLRHSSSIDAMLGPAVLVLSDLSSIDTSLQKDDLTQQAFLIFCHLLDRWDGDPSHEPFLSYVARVFPSRAAHFVRDKLHARARGWGQPHKRDCSLFRHHSNPGDPQAFVAGQNHAQHAHPSEEAIDADLAWHRQIAGLDPHSRTLLTLHFYLGLSPAQIADLSGLSTRTIRRHINAAIRRLRNQFLSPWQDCA